MNFDYIRLYLAVVVMLTHFNFGFEEKSVIFTGSFAVESFFCISGFLISLSFINSKNLEEYFVKRIKRIYPPIIVTILLLMVWGIISHKETNWIVSLHEFLIFEDWRALETNNKIASHPAFWTLVVEFQFYLLVPIFIYALRNKRNISTAVLILLYLLSVYARKYLSHCVEGNSPEFLVIRDSIFIQLSFFIPGIFFAFNYDKIKNLTFRKEVFCFLLGMLLYLGRLSSPLGLAISVIMLARIIYRYFGKNAWFGDMSYGIYIYHFPILYFAMYDSNIAVVGTVLMSLVSWHLMEKKIVK